MLRSPGRKKSRPSGNAGDRDCILAQDLIEVLVDVTLVVALAAGLATANAHPGTVAAAADHDAAAAAAAMAMPAEAAAHAVSALIHAGAIPAVDVEAERDRFGHVDLVDCAGGQSERHCVGARRRKCAGSDDRFDDCRSRAAYAVAGDCDMSKRWRGPLVAVFAAMLAIPAAAQTKKPASPLAIPETPVNPNVDVAFGAFQRGYYMTAFNEAAKRAQQKDTKAMTLLGELYAQGLGVGRDDSKATQWYKQAAALGDRDAIFALAMFNFEGRAGQRNTQDGARLLEAAAKLGHAAAAYDLGLLYLQGTQFPQDFNRAAEFFRQAAEAGNPEAQYALATMYKEGRGVPKNPDTAMSLMGQASVAGNLDAMVEYAIAQFNGDGTPKDEAAAAKLFLIAARRGSAVAQNRIARILMAGRGMPTDPAEAIKWHLVAKAGGAGDPELDVFAGKQTPEMRDAAQKAATKWLSTVAALRP